MIGYYVESVSLKPRRCPFSRFSTAKLAKKYENNKKFGKICNISIIFRNFAAGEINSKPK